ncbi:MAG: YitT family protein [Anaerovoracaceae bacterium]
MKNIIRTSVSILIGNCLLAFMVAAFVIPNEMIMGGVTGISLVLQEYIPLKTSIIVLVLNLIMLAAGGIFLGKKFFCTTIASSLLYPVILGLMQQIPEIENVTDNKLLAAIIGGGLLGIAVGLILRVGSSTGGTDALNLILHKYLHLPVSVFVYITDTLIILWQAVNTEVENVLFGIVLLVIETLVLNQVMMLGQSQVQIFVISEHYEKIRDKILSDLDAGATMIFIENGLMRCNQKGVMSVIPNRKLYLATELIQSIDPNAFIMINKVKEVRGNGFTLERKKIIQ